MQRFGLVFVIVLGLIGCKGVDTEPNPFMYTPDDVEALQIRTFYDELAAQGLELSDAGHEAINTGHDMVGVLTITRPVLHPNGTVEEPEGLWAQLQAHQDTRGETGEMRELRHFEGLLLYGYYNPKNPVHGSLRDRFQEFHRKRMGGISEFSAALSSTTSSCESYCYLGWVPSEAPGENSGGKVVTNKTCYGTASVSGGRSFSGCIYNLPLTQKIGFAEAEYKGCHKEGTAEIRCDWKGGREACTGASCVIQGKDSGKLKLTTSARAPDENLWDTPENTGKARASASTFGMRWQDGETIKLSRTSYSYTTPASFGCTPPNKVSVDCSWKIGEYPGCELKAGVDCAYTAGVDDAKNSIKETITAEASDVEIAYPKQFHSLGPKKVTGSSWGRATNQENWVGQCSPGYGIADTEVYAKVQQTGTREGDTPEHGSLSCEWIGPKAFYLQCGGILNQHRECTSDGQTCLNTPDKPNVCGMRKGNCGWESCGTCPDGQGCEGGQCVEQCGGENEPCCAGESACFDDDKTLLCMPYSCADGTDKCCKTCKSKGDRVTIPAHIRYFSLPSDERKKYNPCCSGTWKNVGETFDGQFECQ